jgi:hypothetical protein
MTPRQVITRERIQRKGDSFVIKSGNGYVYKMRGKNTPMMTSDRAEAMIFGTSQAVIAEEILSAHGLLCTIEAAPSCTRSKPDVET